MKNCNDWISLQMGSHRYVTIFGFCFFMENFITVNIILWKSENAVSTVTKFWKLFDLFVIIRSMQENFNGFLK